jgi:large subunit ribosomal protein L13
MRSAAMKSYLAKTGEIPGDWHIVDAADKPLGRLAASLATILMGKHKPTYTPHVLTGDFIVVINAEKVTMSGRKDEQKEYDRYSYHPGGRKVVPAAEMREKHPERLLQFAVRRMLPKNKLGDHMINRMKVYKGTKHPHMPQRPQPLEPKLK